MPIRLSPSGAVIPPDEIAGELRYPTLSDTTSSGAQTAWVPVQTIPPATTFGSETVGIRCTPPAALILHGMPLEDEQEVTLRCGRNSTFPIIIVPESSLATQDVYKFATPNLQTLFLRRGESVTLRRNEGRVNVQPIGQALVQTLSKTTGTLTADGATTELSVGGVITFPANVLQAGMLFYFEGWCEFVHTAAALPLVDAGFSINGATPNYAAITPAANAGTFQWKVEGYARLIGTMANWRTNVQWKAPFGATAADQLGGAVDLPAVTTTAQTSLDLRIRMRTAVPSNVLNVYNGYGMLIG